MTVTKDLIKVVLLLLVIACPVGWVVQDTYVKQSRTVSLVCDGVVVSTGERRYFMHNDKSGTWNTASGVYAQKIGQMCQLRQVKK